MFISNAYAQAAAATPPSAMGQLASFLPIILMFVIFWFLLIRPQMKRQKEHRALLEALKKGDEVVTAGGIVGEVTAVKDQYVTVSVNQGDATVEMLLQKQAVQTVLPKGTIKAL